MKKFKRIYIEITNVCNLNCEFCPKTRRDAQFMNAESFAHILKEVSPHTDFIYFHVLGEPLLHPDLKKLLALSDENGFKVNITTNGTLIKKQTDTLLNSTALRQLNFSLHSFEANEKSNTLDSYINNVLDFIETAEKNSQVICSMRLWNLQENEVFFNSGVNSEDVNKNQDILALIEKRLNLGYKISEKLKESSRIKLANNIYLNAASRFQWPDISTDDSDLSGFCHGLRDQIGILVDGTVIPCCLDGEGTINLGNIFNTSFVEIINGHRAKEMYDGFSRREIVEELCKKCDYRRRFNK